MLCKIQLPEKAPPEVIVGKEGDSVEPVDASRRSDQMEQARPRQSIEPASQCPLRLYGVAGTLLVQLTHFTNHFKPSFAIAQYPRQSALLYLYFPQQPPL